MADKQQVNDYRPAELHRLSYWASLKDPLATVGIPIEEIKTVEVEAVKRGLFSERLWYFIHFVDQDNARRGSVFAKVHHPLKPMDDLARQAVHLGFWNRCNFPTPKYIDYLEAVDRFEGKDYRTSALVMEQFKSWTIDKYLIAINQVLGRWSEADNFVPPKKRDQIEALKKLRLDLLGQSLEVLVNLAIVGTSTLNNQKNILNAEVLINTPEPNEKAFIEKGKKAMIYAICWSYIQTGIVSRVDLDKVLTGQGELSSELMNVKRTIAQYNALLSETLHYMFPFILNLKVYSQGDPEPHNFSAKKENGSFKVNIFDSSHAGWGSLYEIFARFLTNPFLGISRQESIETFLRVQKETHIRASESNLDIGQRLNPTEALKSFGFLSAYDLLVRIGRFAFHDLGKNWEYWRDFVSQSLVYSPLGAPILDDFFKDTAQLEDPSIGRVSMGAYKPELVIPILRRRLAEVLIELGDHDLNSEEAEVVKTLFRLTKDHMDPKTLLSGSNGPPLIARSGTSEGPSSFRPVSHFRNHTPQQKVESVN